MGSHVPTTGDSPPNIQERILVKGKAKEPENHHPGLLCNLKPSCPISGYFSITPPPQRSPEPNLNPKPEERKKSLKQVHIARRFWCHHQIIYVKFTYFSYLQVTWYTWANVKRGKIASSYFPKAEIFSVMRNKAVPGFSGSHLGHMRSAFPMELGSLNTYAYTPSSVSHSPIVRITWDTLQTQIPVPTTEFLNLNLLGQPWECISQVSLRIGAVWDTLHPVTYLGINHYYLGPFFPSFQPLVFFLIKAFSTVF